MTQKTYDQQTKEIEGISKEVLAQWWCQLNSHGWPEALGEPEPRDAPEPRRRTILMNKIMETIGFKECLREWNKETLPGEAFDNWFATTKMSD